MTSLLGRKLNLENKWMKRVKRQFKSQENTVNEIKIIKEP